jgi:P-type E1-E2 ATPase
MAASRGADVSLPGREARRRQLFRFDPRLKLMSTVDERGGCLVVSVKGAPEEVMARVARLRRAAGQEAERDLCLIGLVALRDPPRPEVPDAISQVHRAGIRVHVVTGDNGLTAAAIAHHRDSQAGKAR